MFIDEIVERTGVNVEIVEKVIRDFHKSLFNYLNNPEYCGKGIYLNNFLTFDLNEIHLNRIRERAIANVASGKNIDESRVEYYNTILNSLKNKSHEGKTCEKIYNDGYDGESQG